MRLGPLKLKAQLYRGDDLAMGPGKADLLDAIDEHGSISAAGRRLGMSYRRAWMLVDTMNRCWREPMVDTRSGGGADRGATVTEFGHAVLTAYRKLEHQLESAASGETMAFLTHNLLEPPSTAG